MKDVINGRLEKELAAEKKINDKLKTLPSIISEFYYDMSGSNKSYMTLNKYVEYVEDFLRYLDPDDKEEFYKDIKPNTISKYMSSIRNKEVNGTVVRLGDSIRAVRWSALNSFFEFLKGNGYVQENPVSYTKRPKINENHSVTYLTQEEIQKVMDNVRENATYRSVNRDLCIIGLAISTGLRVSAIVQININDINFKNKTIRVIEKGEKYRNIPFGENTKQLLLNWLKDRELYYNPYDGTNALFISQKKERMSTDAVRRMVEKYTSGVVEKHITPHKLRASAATNLAASGTSIQAIAKILGHENIQTTRRYVEVLDQEAEDAVNVLDNLI